MDENRKEQLAWFVDFANLDIKNLKAGDKAKLMVEADEYLFPTEREIKAFSLFTDRHRHYGDPSAEGKKMTAVSDVAGWIGDSRPAKDSKWYWEVIEKLLNETKRAFQIFLDRKENSFWILGIGGYEWKKEDKEHLSFGFYPIAGSHEEYLFHKLLTLFDGIPDTTIRKCLRCGKYFFNSTRREKKFCSSLCMWRHNAKEQRERDREGYNEKQREIMRKRYEEKKHKEKGIAKIKIEGRSARKGE